MKFWDEDLVRALKNLKRALQNGHLPDQKGIVGSSRTLLAQMRLACWIVANGRALTIFGPRGTGKSALARWIADSLELPFTPVNCGALGDLAASELFGYGAGTFTGAQKNGKAGLLDRQGIVFLDEMGAASHDVQAMLLQVLQDGTFRRVGEAQERHCQALIICATWEKGALRDDLYDRMRQGSVELPALSERLDDLPVIAGHILQSYSATLSAASLKTLRDEDWPGNIRQLETALRRAADLVEMRGGGVIELATLEEGIAHARSGRDEMLQAGGPQAGGVARVDARTIPRNPHRIDARDLGKPPVQLDNHRWAHAYRLTREQGAWAATLYRSRAGVSKRVALYDLGEMIDRGIVERLGASRSTTYRWVAGPPAGGAV